MIIKLLKTGHEYNLAIESDFKHLRKNIATMRHRNQWDRLAYIYSQVCTFQTYTGVEPSLHNAKIIALLTANTPQSIQSRPVTQAITSHPTSSVPTAMAAASSSSDSPSLVPSTSTQSQTYVPLTTAETIFVVSMAPLNSSGDIYHILAYLILLQASNHVLPKVQLNYDIDASSAPCHSTLTVGDQVKRSLDFAATLGLAEHFSLEKLPYNNTGRECARQKQLETHFSERSAVENIWYLDQMATTALISHDVLEHGFETITHVLQQGFAKRSEAGFPVVAQQAVDAYVSNAMRQINSLRKYDAQPLIVLHVRHSSTANNHLNLPDAFINQLAIYLHNQHYQVCFVLADDRKLRSHYLESCAPEMKASFVMLEPFKDKSFLIGSVDYAKQAHLQLLQGLRQYPLTRGVIGNTSGTLDIAAMIGLTTYCIHQFTDSRLSYQECRLYFQLAFMSLGALIWQGTVYGDTGLQSWLDNPKPRTGIGLFDHPPGSKSFAERVAEKRQEPGFNKMFSVTFFQKGTAQQVELPRASEVIGRLSQDH
jgi:hypothetical protein